jgi:hypothetical protein
MPLLIQNMEAHSRGKRGRGDKMFTKLWQENVQKWSRKNKTMQSKSHAIHVLYFFVALIEKFEKNS